MSILDSVITTRPGAPRITIYGVAGVGKSTLASKFPNPLFILTEDNELSNIQAIPTASTFTEVWKTVKGLLAEEDLQYKTIVIDSISKLDKLIVEHILENEPLGKNGQKASTLTAACGGYGAGFARAASIASAFKGLMDEFKKRGIAVVYLAHVTTATIKPPDNEDYSVFTIVSNHDKSRHIWIDDVDAVLYCKLKSFTYSTDTGRNVVKSTDERIIVSGINEGHVSKTRYTMPNEIPMDFDVLASYIPFFNGSK